MGKFKSVNKVATERILFPVFTRSSRRGILRSVTRVIGELTLVPQGICLYIWQAQIGAIVGGVLVRTAAATPTLVAWETRPLMPLISNIPSFLRPIQQPEVHPEVGRSCSNINR